MYSLAALLPTCTTTALALIGATMNALPSQQLQAYYPFLTDLLDVTGNYGPAALFGTAQPPNGSMCLNGVYLNGATIGQDVRTPLLTTLDTTDFEIAVEFNVTAFPPGVGPVLMGGNGWRWLGIYLQSNGTIGIKHNNSNLSWSGTTVTTGQWYFASLKYEAGVAQLWLNGALVHQATVGPLSDGNNKNLCTNDYSNGTAFNGCIRNLLVSNDTTIVARATPFGAGCPGIAGTPLLAPATMPALGTSFDLSAANLEPVVPFAFLSLGLSNTSSRFGPLPLSLQLIGLGAGCDLLTSAEAAVLFGVAGGAGTFNFGVPTNPRYVGTHLYFQCASIDSSAAGGIALSNGVDAVIGY